MSVSSNVLETQVYLLFIERVTRFDAAARARALCYKSTNICSNIGRIVSYLKEN